MSHAHRSGTQEATSSRPPQEKEMATWALCLSRGGLKDSNHAQKFGDRAPASSTDPEHRAKHFHKAAVPDPRRKALQRQSRGRAILCSWMTSGGSCCADAELSEPYPAALRLPGELLRNTGLWRKRKPHYRSVSNRGQEKGSRGRRWRGRKRWPRRGSGGLEAARSRDGRTPGRGGEAGLVFQGCCRARASGEPEDSCAKSTTWIFGLAGRNKRHPGVPSFGQAPRAQR